MMACAKNTSSASMNLVPTMASQADSAIKSRITTRCIFKNRTQPLRWTAEAQQDRSGNAVKVKK